VPAKGGGSASHAIRRRGNVSGFGFGSEKTVIALFLARVAAKSGGASLRVSSVTV